MSDGSGLTSRQVATQAAAAGHVVDVVAPTRLCLAAFTGHVRRVRRVPVFGKDPWGWLDATFTVLRSERYDVLLPTHEQVALLARASARVQALGVALAVPPFESVTRVQDKVAQAGTLRDLGLPRPNTLVVTSPDELCAVAEPPVYLKAPIGTASNGVSRAGDRAALKRAAANLDFRDGVVVQEALDGPLVMIQAVFAAGRLIAWHVNLREREGSAGGACVKRSIKVPVVSAHLQAIGVALHWHGALSLDAILTPDGPRYIDINPRLVEPGNAWRSGVDLVGALLAASLREPFESPSPGSADVRTHQLLIAILGAAQRCEGRRGILRELTLALAHRGPYRESSEELTPIAGDPLALLPTAAAAAVTLTHPEGWRLLAERAVSAYALTTDAWRQIAPAIQARDRSRR